MPMLVVGAALIDGRGRVLVQQRPAGKQHAGLWEFPGGKIEAGETPEAALCRELHEELTITVDAGDLTAEGFATGPGIVLLLFGCRRWQGAPVATDGATLRWIEAGALSELPMPPADVPLIPAVRRLVGDQG